MGTPADKRTWKWWSRMVGGWALVLVGLAGFVLPIIPGIPLLLGGLALLAPEYEWARKAMTKVKGWTNRLRGKKPDAEHAEGKADPAAKPVP